MTDTTPVHDDADPVAARDAWYAQPEDDMPVPRRSTDPDRLSDEQRDALEAAKKAQAKVKRAKSAQDGAIAARDDLIRSALDAGVGVMLLAQQLGVNGALIWKIRKGLTTQDVERRREAGNGG